MKRKSSQGIKSPDYPSFQEFHENKHAWLKTLGVGAVGLAMNACQQSPPLGGVPPVPDASDASGHGAGGSGNKSECDPKIPVPGVPAPPVLPKQPDGAKVPKPAPEGKAKDPFEEIPGNRPMILGGIGAPEPPRQFPPV